MKSAPVRKPSAEKPPQPVLKVVRQVSLLPAGMQKAIRDLLVQGSTIEAAAQSVNERDDWNEPAPEESAGPVRCNITAEAVRDYYNADRELQRDRAHYLVETTEAIKRSLSRSGDMEEGESRWVHSVVMAGLTRINDSDAPLTVKDSLRLRAEIQNLQLKNRLLRLRSSQALMQRAYWKSQRALMEQKKKFLTQQTTRLRDAVQKLEKKRKLTPETLQKIQETYGILAESAARAEAAQNPVDDPAAGAGIEHAAEPLFFARPEEITDDQQLARECAEEAYRISRGEEEQL